MPNKLLSANSLKYVTYNNFTNPENFSEQIEMSHLCPFIFLTVYKIVSYKIGGWNNLRLPQAVTVDLIPLDKPL